MIDPYAWRWDPEGLALVPALALVYALALRLFPASRARIAAFVAGLLLLLFTFVSPLETIALHYLLSAHLLQNVVLAEWAPALLVYGLPPALAAELARLPAVRVLTRPLVALPLWLGTYFVWHVPWVYDTALEHPGSILHLEHLTYLATGSLFWWSIFHTKPRSLPAGARAAYLFAAFVGASPLGLLLALLPRAVYGFYADGPGLWGLSPLTDQQIAGVTMASEQAVVFFVAFAYFFRRFLVAEAADGVYRGARETRR